MNDAQVWGTPLLLVAPRLVDKETRSHFVQGLILYKVSLNHKKELSSRRVKSALSMLQVSNSPGILVWMRASGPPEGPEKPAFGEMERMLSFTI